MKNKILTALTVSALSLALASGQVMAAERYTLDPSHTNVVWKTSHFGFSSPSGKFTNIEGDFVLDENNPENSYVSVKIYPSSILTGIEKFDAHLKSADFFNVEKYGTATFKSTRVEMTGSDTAKIHGELTLLGVTNPVTLDATLNKIGVNPLNNTKTAGFSARTTIKRSAFGMDWGVPNVGDNVLIEIETEGMLGES